MDLPFARKGKLINQHYYLKNIFTTPCKSVYIALYVTVYIAV